MPRPHFRRLWATGGAVVNKIGLFLKHAHVFDHCLRKTFYGFKELVLGYFDGLSTIPVDFSMHSEKALKLAKRKKQYKKDVRPGSAGGKRRKELKRNKIHQAVDMIKRAVKHGFIAQYLMRLLVYQP